MSRPNDPCPELEQLTDAALDGTCDPAQAERLRERLRTDPAALAAYLDQVRLHALLQWRHGRARREVPPAPEGTDVGGAAKAVARPLRIDRWRRRAVAAAVLLTAAL